MMDELTDRITTAQHIHCASKNVPLYMTYVHATTPKSLYNLALKMHCALPFYYISQLLIQANVKNFFYPD